VQGENDRRRQWGRDLGAEAKAVGWGWRKLESEEKEETKITVRFLIWGKENAGERNFAIYH